MSVPELQLASPAVKSRWYVLAPGRILLALLAVEGFLLLSERFGWLPLNKGWTVLLALGTICPALLFRLVCFVASLIFRWHFQFSIRSLLLLITVSAILCSWLANEMQWARRQERALDELDKQRFAGHDYELVESAWPTCWLRGPLGDDFFASVTWLYLGGPEVQDAALEHVPGLPQLQRLSLDYAQVTDAGLEHLKGMTQLQRLSILHCSQVSDAGLEHLKGLRHLQEMALYGTRVTDQGVKKLQQALPNCTIDWWPPTPEERQRRAAPDQPSG